MALEKDAAGPVLVHLPGWFYYRGALMNGYRFVIALVLIALVAAGFIILGIPDFG